jgi:hypothetical protein
MSILRRIAARLRWCLYCGSTGTVNGATCPVCKGTP